MTGWASEAFARAVREQAAARPRRRIGIGVGRIIMLGVAAILLYLVAPSVAVFAAWPQLSRVSPGWFLVVLAGQVLSFGCLFVLQRMALRTDAWFSVVTSQLAGNAVSRIVPGGAAARRSAAVPDAGRRGGRGDAGGLRAHRVLHWCKSPACSRCRCWRCRPSWPAPTSIAAWPNPPSSGVSRSS
jgi:hypothetical protein